MNNPFGFVWVWLIALTLYGGYCAVMQIVRAIRWWQAAIYAQRQRDLSQAYILRQAQDAGREDL